MHHMGCPCRSAQAKRLFLCLGIAKANGLWLHSTGRKYVLHKAGAQPFCRNQDRFMNDSWEGLGVAGMDDNNIFCVVKI